MDKPQHPPQAHYDAGPYYGGDPNQQQYDQNRGYNNYGPPQGPPQGQYYGPPGPMQYGQGPPPQQYYVQQQPQKSSGGAGGCCAGIAAALACCCCLDCLF